MSQSARSTVALHETALSAVRDYVEDGEETGILIGPASVDGPATADDAAGLAEVTDARSWSSEAVAQAHDFVRRWHPGKQVVGWFWASDDKPTWQGKHTRVAAMFGERSALALILDSTCRTHALFAPARAGQAGRPVAIEHALVAEDGTERRGTSLAHQFPGLDPARLASSKAALAPDAPGAPDLLDTAAIEIDVRVGRRSRKQLITPVFKPCAARVAPGSRPAAAVVFHERRLHDQEERMLAHPAEMGVLLGNFGRRGAQDFVLVTGYRPLPGEGMDRDDRGRSYVIGPDWLREPDRLAFEAARIHSAARRNGDRVVGWYFRAPRQSEGMPEAHDAVRRLVFEDRRFVTLAFFADGVQRAASAPAGAPLVHRAYTGEAGGTGDVTPLSSVELLPVPVAEKERPPSDAPELVPSGAMADKEPDIGALARADARAEGRATMRAFSRIVALAALAFLCLSGRKILGAPGVGPEFRLLRIWAVGSTIATVALAIAVAILLRRARRAHRRERDG